MGDNLLLSGLSRSDAHVLKPYLKPVELPVQEVLARRGKRISAVYFLESGFASVVANGGNRAIGIGLIGREGMTGVSVLLGNDRTSNEVIMQVAGRGQCIRAADLRAAIDNSVSLHRSLLRYADTFFNQVALTSAANGQANIAKRLARCLLMVDDRLDEPDLPLAHRFFAMMLGVRRPGITVAMQELERLGVVTCSRGRVVIVDRDELEALSTGTYTNAA